MESVCVWAGLVYTWGMVSMWIGGVSRPRGGVRSLESDLLTSLDPDLDDGPEPGHVLHKNHPTGRRSHIDLHTHTHRLMLHTKTGVGGTLVSCDPRCEL